MSVVALLSSGKDSTVDEQKKWLSSLSFINEENIVTQDIDLAMANRFKFDFVSLLLVLSVPRHLLYPTMLLNKFKSFNEYNGETVINMVDNQYLENFYKDNIK